MTRDEGNLPDDLSARLDALRDGFRPKLRERLERLLAFALQMAQGTASYSDEEIAKQIAHRVRGTAGSYGFEAAGELAQTFERAIANPSGADRDYWRSLASDLTRLIASDCSYQEREAT